MSQYLEHCSYEECEVPDCDELFSDSMALNDHFKQIHEISSLEKSDLNGVLVNQQNEHLVKVIFENNKPGKLNDSKNVSSETNSIHKIRNNNFVSIDDQSEETLNNLLDELNRDLNENKALIYNDSKNIDLFKLGLENYNLDSGIDNSILLEENFVNKKTKLTRNYLLNEEALEIKYSMDIDEHSDEDLNNLIQEICEDLDVNNTVIDNYDCAFESVMIDEQSEEILNNLLRDIYGDLNINNDLINNINSPRSKNQFINSPIASVKFEIKLNTPQIEIGSSESSLNTIVKNDSLEINEEIENLVSSVLEEVYNDLNFDMDTRFYFNDLYKHKNDKTELKLKRTADINLNKRECLNMKKKRNAYKMTKGSKSKDDTIKAEQNNSNILEKSNILMIDSEPKNGDPSSKDDLDKYNDTIQVNALKEYKVKNTPDESNLEDLYFTDTINEELNENYHTTNNEKLQCQFCDDIFFIVNHIIEHLRTHLMDISNKKVHLKCTARGCDYQPPIFQEGGKTRVHKTSQLLIIEDHLRSKHIKELYKQCSECQKKFSSGKALAYHMKQHKESSKQLCNGCDHFIKITQLQKHKEKGCAMSRIFLCKICTKGFKTERNLEVHAKTHTKDKSYKCNYCSKSFVQKGNCQTHVMKKHPLQALQKEDMRTHEDFHIRYTDFNNTTKDELNIKRTTPGVTIPEEEGDRISYASNLINNETDKKISSGSENDKIERRKMEAKPCLVELKDIKKDTSKTVAVRMTRSSSMKGKTFSKTRTLELTKMKDQKQVDAKATLLEYNTLEEVNSSQIVMYCCNEAFSASDIKRHNLEAHSNNKPNCPKCYEIFEDLKTLSLHYNEVHEVQYYPLKNDLKVKTDKKKNTLHKVRISKTTPARRTVDVNLKVKTGKKKNTLHKVRISKATPARRTVDVDLKVKTDKKKNTLHKVRISKATPVERTVDVIKKQAKSVKTIISEISRLLDETPSLKENSLQKMI